MSTSGSFLDLKEWACRLARFDSSNSSDLALAGAAVNDAYLSTCGTGDPWDFLQQEGTWVTTAGSDVYTYSTIASAMSITGASIDEIIMLSHDTEGLPLESMSWPDLERWSYDTQDDAGGLPFFWSKWAQRIRLYPNPDQAYTLGCFVRLAPSEMSGDTDTPLIPLAWRRRLLSTYAASTLVRTEGGLGSQYEADSLMNNYQRDFLTFRTAHAVAKRPTFRVTSPGWEARNPVRQRGGAWSGW